MDKVSTALWRPQTAYFLIGGFVVLIIALVAAYIVNNFVPTTPLRLGSGVYSLRIADTDAERAQGLSGVEKLASNEGLLMKYDGDGKWGIWMKDMKIPLDIVWLDKDKVVVYIVKGASPELGTTMTFEPKSPARYIVELPAGAVDQAAIKTGITADFDEHHTGSLW